MSQRQLAQQSGVDHSTISRLIRGDRMPSLGTATKLARGLRELRDDADTPQYLGLVAAGSMNPTARVEYALRADDLLTEPQVRQIMEYYLAVRMRRYGRTVPADRGHRGHRGPTRRALSSAAPAAPHASDGRQRVPSSPVGVGVGSVRPVSTHIRAGNPAATRAFPGHGPDRPPRPSLGDSERRRLGRRRSRFRRAAGRRAVRVARSAGTVDARPSDRAPPRTGRATGASLGRRRREPTASDASSAGPPHAAPIAVGEEVVAHDDERRRRRRLARTIARARRGRAGRRYVSGDLNAGSERTATGRSGRRRRDPPRRRRRRPGTRHPAATGGGTWAMFQPTRRDEGDGGHDERRPPRSAVGAAASARPAATRARPRRPDPDEHEDHRVGERVVVVVGKARDDGASPGAANVRNAAVQASPSPSQRTATALAASPGLPPAPDDDRDDQRGREQRPRPARP